MSLIKGTLLLWFVNGQAVAGHPVHAALSGAPHRPVVSVALWGARKVPMSSQLMVVAPLAIIIVGLCWRSHHVILSVAFRPIFDCLEFRIALVVASSLAVVGVLVTGTAFARLPYQLI